MIDVATHRLWEVSDYYIDMSTEASEKLSEVESRAYDQACRLTLDKPGFSLVNLGAMFGSRRMREFMIELKQHLDRRHQERTGQRLVYRSMGRFDQQVTTKPHRDNGPDESLLMLGYEPSEVQSNVELTDHTRCAFEHGLSPVEFIDRHNPMFDDDATTQLSRFVTPLEPFDNHSFQILIINNSQSSPGSDRLLGVLHTAEVLNPTPKALRIVNSTMIVVAHDESAEVISQMEQTRFTTDNNVSKRY